MPTLLRLVHAENQEMSALLRQPKPKAEVDHFQWAGVLPVLPGGQGDCLRRYNGSGAKEHRLQRQAEIFSSADDKR